MYIRRQSKTILGNIFLSSFLQINDGLVALIPETRSQGQLENLV